MPKLAMSLGVKIVAGPYANREHILVMVMESDKAEAVDKFISDSRLSQWNRVRVLPSESLAEQGVQEVMNSKPLF